METLQYEHVSITGLQVCLIQLGNRLRLLHVVARRSFGMKNLRGWDRAKRQESISDYIVKHLPVLLLNHVIIPTIAVTEANQKSLQQKTLF
jgi:hypothetical protein